MSSADEPRPIVDFLAPGLPQTKGSTKAFIRRRGGKPFAVITNDNEKNDGWAYLVSYFATQCMAGRPPIDGPVHVTLTFLLPRPQDHFGTGRNAGRLRPSASPKPDVKPDLDKMQRSIFDALSRIVYRDDACVTTAVIMKRYAETQPGVRVRVELDP